MREKQLGRVRWGGGGGERRNRKTIASHEEKKKKKRSQLFHSWSGGSTTLIIVVLVARDSNMWDAYRTIRHHQYTFQLYPLAFLTLLELVSLSFPFGERRGILDKVSCASNFPFSPYRLPSMTSFLLRHTSLLRAHHLCNACDTSRFSSQSIPFVEESREPINYAADEFDSDQVFPPSRRFTFACTWSYFL